MTTRFLVVLTLAATAASPQVQVTELEHAVPEGVTVVDCPAVFTVPVVFEKTEPGRELARWTLENHRCDGLEILRIGPNILRNRRRGLEAILYAHLEPSFDRLLRGRIQLLDGDGKEIARRKVEMEIEEGRSNMHRIRFGRIDDVSRIASVALTIYAVVED